MILLAKNTQSAENKLKDLDTLSIKVFFVCKYYLL